MKRWLWIVLLFLPHTVLAQTRTTVTASIQDSSGNPATAGYVEFRLQPASTSLAYRVTGTTVIAPQTSRCSIVAGALSNCSVWGNTTLQPASSCYDVVIAPNNQVRTTTRQSISGTGYDLSTPVFCTNVNVVPQYQTITAAPIQANLVPLVNKVFNLGDSGHYYAQAYVDTLFATTATIANLTTSGSCASFPGADASQKIVACIAALPFSGGIADARGLTGPQTLSSNICAGIAGKPVTLLLSATVFSTLVTQTCSSGTGLRIIGTNGGGDTATGTQFHWDGSNGGTVLYFDSTRDSEVWNIAIEPGSGTIGIGLRVDGSNATFNRFHSLSIGASTTAVQIGNTSTSGNDLHEFDDLHIFGAGTYGVYINDGQSKFIRINHGSITNRTNGIFTVSGSYSAHEVNFSGNVIDNALTNIDDTITIENCQSESANKFLSTVAGSSSSAWSVNLIGNRAATNNVGVDHIYLTYLMPGPLNLFGNDFASGINNDAIRFNIAETPAGSYLNSIGNIYPNEPLSKLFTGSGIPLLLTSHGDLYIPTGGGSAVHVDDVFSTNILTSYAGCPGACVTKLNSRVLINGTSSDVATGALVNLGAITEANSPVNAQTVMIEALGGGGGAIFDSSHTGNATTKDIWWTFDFITNGAPPAAKLTTNGVYEIVKSYSGATVSDAGTVALRNNNGVLECSQDGGGWGSCAAGGGALTGSCATVGRLPQMGSSTSITCSPLGNTAGNLATVGAELIANSAASDTFPITANAGSGSATSNVLFKINAVTKGLVGADSSGNAFIRNASGGNGAVTVENATGNVDLDGGNGSQTKVNVVGNGTLAGSLLGVNTGGGLLELITASGSFIQVTGTTANIGLNSGQYGNMVGGVSIGLATTAPTTNPAFGFLIYVDPADNKLKVRGASGTVTPLANP